MSESIDRWFKAEILAHEISLNRFLRRSWPDSSEVDDIRQDVYVRVYKAATKSLPHSGKAFLFATARNLLVDRIRRSRVVSIDAIGGWKELDDLEIFRNEQSPERIHGVDREIERMLVALDRLPLRAKEVLLLRRVEGLPQKEVARKLKISEGAVEKSLARALKHLTTLLFGGDDSEQDAVTKGNIDQYESRRRHGKLKRY